MEILNNTLIKLIVRQGSDSDRKAVTFNVGEPLMTTDTERLFVGNGLLGGTIVGNLFQGISPDITTFTSSYAGDLAFDNDKNNLFVLSDAQSSNLSAWTQIGGVYQSIDNHITINDSNKISLNPLSAGYIDSTLLGNSLEIVNGKVSLSATASIDELSPRSGSSIKLPNNLNINGTVYRFPSTNPLAGQILQFEDNIGTLKPTFIDASAISNNTITVSDGLNATVDGVDKTDQPINALASDIIIQSNQLYATYNGLSAGGLINNRGITDVEKLSTGHYVFAYDDIGSSTLIPMCQILGEDALGYIPRVVSITSTECHVKIMSNTGPTTLSIDGISSDTTTDANIVLLISY